MNKSASIFLWIPFVVFLVSCQKDEHFGNGWEENNLKGSPKRVTEIHDYGSNSVYKYETQFSSTGHIEYEKSYEKDNLTRIVGYFYRIDNPSLCEKKVEKFHSSSDTIFHQFYYTSEKSRDEIYKFGKTTEVWDKGKVIMKDNYFNEGNTSKITYFYDDKGNLNRITNLMKNKPAGPVVLRETIFSNYQFDEKGNWISHVEEVSQDKQKEGEYIVKRIIEY